MAETFIMIIADIAVQQKCFDQILNITFGDGETIENSLLGVTENIQEDPCQNRRRKDITGHEVDIAHPSHREGSASLYHGICPRGVDIEARCHQKNDGKGETPMIEAEQYAPAFMFFVRHSNLLAVFPKEKIQWLEPLHYRAFTLTVSFPSGSSIWTAQAMHGSKEWIVRSTSKGFSASAMGLPINEAS